MQILAVVGSLRAGKSTLVESTILQATQSGALGHKRAAYLLNDRPSPDGRMVDGEKIRNVARVIPFPNRCFTCEDAENLARQLHTLSHEGEIDLVVIEGYGFVAGAETREALELTGFPFDIFSLVDAEHLSENRAAYGEVIESQIASATLGIGITHAVNGETEVAFDLVARHVKHGVPALVIPKGYGMPTRLFARALFGDQHEHHHNHDECGCGHHHGLHYHGQAHRHHPPHEHRDHDHHNGHVRGHHHDHHGHDHHGHDHDFFSVTYPLRAEVTMGMLKDALASADVFRAKGVTSGIRFDMLHGTWNESDKTNQPGIITIYSRVSEVQLPDRFIDDKARTDTDHRSTKDLLRQDVDPESARAALARLADAIPLEPVILPGSDGLRVAVQLEELQLLKQIAQRPSVKDAWLLKAVSVAIRYWVACAEFILEHHLTMDANELSISRLELGLSLGWWTNRFERDLEPALVAAVANCKVGGMLVYGVRGSPNWMHSNPKRAALQAPYFRDILNFAAKHGEESSVRGSYAKFIFAQGIALAASRGAEAESAWHRAAMEVM